MQTLARPIDFPVCPLGDKCADRNPNYNHDHRFDQRHQVWFGCAQTLLNRGDIFDGMTKSELSRMIDDLLRGVTYDIKGYVRDYAMTLIEVRCG